MFFSLSSPFQIKIYLKIWQFCKMSVSTKWTLVGPPSRAGNSRLHGLAWLSFGHREAVFTQGRTLRGVSAGSTPVLKPVSPTMAGGRHAMRRWLLLQGNFQQEELTFPTWVLTPAFHSCSRGGDSPGVLGYAIFNVQIITLQCSFWCTWTCYLCFRKNFVFEVN